MISRISSSRRIVYNRGTIEAIVQCTSLQSRCSNVCRNERQNTWSTAAFRSPTSPLVTIYSPPVDNSTSLDCVALPTKHIRAFSVGRPTTWNDLRDPSCSIGDFRRMLKTALFISYWCRTVGLVIAIEMLHEIAPYNHCRH